MPRQPNKRKRPVEPENHERWLITYSDLITLLMIFFVIMYAMSQVSQAKFQALEKSLASALHSQNKIQLNNTGTTALIQAANPSNQGDHQKQSSTSANDKALDNLYSQVKSYIDQHNLQANVSIVNESIGVRITLQQVVLFGTGQATIKPQAQGILKGLIPFFQQLGNPIEIQGYTDDQPINTSIYPTNWELSAARAVDVVRFLASQGVDPSRLSGTGYGQYHPVVKNDSQAHRQMNRRVDIVIMRQANQTN